MNTKQKNFYCADCEKWFDYDEVAITLSMEAVCPECNADLEYN